MPTGEFRIVQQRQGDVIEEPTMPRGLVPAQAVSELDHHDRETRLIGDFRLLAMIIGTVAAGAIAWTSPHDDPASQQPWLVFVLISALLGAVAGEAFGFGLSRWREVRSQHQVVLWRVGLSILTVLTVAIGLIGAAPYLFGDGLREVDALTERGVLLSAVAIVGGLTTAATLSAIKQAAGSPLPGPPGQQLDALLRLRKTASRMLNQLGLLVLLVMGVNASAVGWGTELPQGVVIFSGVVASFVVGVMYVPTASTLRRRGALFMDRHFSLNEVPKAELVAAAEARAKLEKLLHLDQTTFGELKAGMVVLTPVVVSLLATLIPK